MATEISNFKITEAWSRGRQFVAKELWQFDLSPRSWTTSLVRFLQFSIMVGQGFVSDRLLLRASALTFVTALSTIPLLVVVVAMIGIVGGQKSLIGLIVDPMTAVSPEATAWITSRIEEVDIGNLGSLGGATLIFSAILALRHLESTLGEIWGVHQSRSWTRRFADYLAVLVVAPILTGVAFSLWASLGSESFTHSLDQVPVLGGLYRGILLQLPQAMMWLAFAFLYWFFPNTQVNVRSAIVGAFVATVLFSLTRVIYVGMGIGATKYSVLFGGLVALPLVLTWIYVCWSVVLFGAEVAYAHQHIHHYREDRLRLHLPPAEKEALGVRIMLAIARSFNAHHGPKSAESLSEDLDLSVRVIREMLDELEEGNLIIRGGDSDRDPGFLPRYPLADTTIADVIVTIRGRRSVASQASDLMDPGQPGSSPHAGARVEAIFSEWDDALSRVAGSDTLAELVNSPRA
ncbi:MAG: YihY/virulence factor BrkB family protein [Myxococcota bacterium]|nr:YihY/virulence factor BrkB family protein [Myxococcota bacterium]